MSCARGGVFWEGGVLCPKTRAQGGGRYWAPEPLLKSSERRTEGAIQGSWYMQPSMQGILRRGWWRGRPIEGAYMGPVEGRYMGTPSTWGGEQAHIEGRI